MPIDYKKYHPLWKEKIRPEILARAKYKCENCKVKHKAKGYRINGVFHDIENSFDKNWAKENGLKVIRIILTIAHLDHDRTNNDYSNLKALCQKCHLDHDRADNILRRKSKVFYTGSNQE